MTYGQTSSGKTFTLFGDKEDKSQPGIIRQYLENLYQDQNEISKFDDCGLKIDYSFFEIYNEKIFDMLSNDTSKKLTIRDNSKDNIFIENLSSKEATSLEDLISDLLISF